jgi:NAD(P)H-flavin reductase
MNSNPYLPYLARIKSIKNENIDTKLFEFELLDQDVRKKFDYDSMQFVMLSVFGVGEAPFSISSTPSRRGSIELGVRAVGDVTNALHRMKVNDIVGIRGPYGKGIKLDEIEGKNLLIVAGGLGLVPLRSLINNILDNRDRFGKMQILYGTKSYDELLFKSELEKWKNSKDVELLVTLDKPDKRWKGHIGIVTTLFKESRFTAYNTIAIICGPPVMYKFVIKCLETIGFTPDQVYVSLERMMKCGVGKCGHCNINNLYVCKDGPVFKLNEISNLQEAL